jgi:hypothetical protein
MAIVISITMLVCGFNHLEKYESQLEKMMFQTTNQIIYQYIYMENNNL